MLIPYTILEECLVLGSNLVCSGAVQRFKGLLCYHNQEM
jgi:hypothetical protein